MEIDIDRPTRPQIAAALGIKVRWLGDLRSLGEMPPEGATMAENVQAWVARHMPAAKGKAGVEVLDREQEQARLAKEQADAKAMDNAERRKDLAPLSDVTEVMTEIVTMALARLQQIPAEVARGDARLQKKLEAAINDALEDLSVAKVEEIVGGERSMDGGPEEEV